MIRSTATRGYFDFRNIAQHGEKQCPPGRKESITDSVQ